MNYHLKSFLLWDVLILLIFIAISCTKPETHFLNSSIKVADWLESNAIETHNGKVWAANPDDSTTIATDLYSGSAGVVLYFLELYHNTRNPIYLENAKSGANHLVATLPETLVTPGQAGLYTGVSGIGYVLEETYKATGEDRYRNGALYCVELLHRSASRIGSGVHWDNVTDIISGSAGIGLFLLYAANEMDHQSSKELAVNVGQRLLEMGIPVETGMKWAMSPDYPRLMPNFSHGTAGICYFLTTLYNETKQHKFLESAIAGGEYLLSITNENGFIFHHEPGGEDLFYLGWCHGPVGTARLYFQLWEITGDDRWLHAIQKAAKGIMQSGIPEKQSP